MNEKNLQAVEGAEEQRVYEFVLALKAIRATRIVVFVPLLGALLVPLATFAAAKWGPLRSAGSTEPVGKVVAPDADEPQTDVWLVRASHLMTGAPAVARAATILLILLYFLAVTVCLSGGYGGAADAIIAFVWAVALFVVIVPWHSWIGGSCGLEVFYGVGDLLDAEEVHQGAWPTVRADWGYYVRFLIFPFLALLAAVVADIRFGRSYRTVMRRVRRHVEAASR